MDIDPDISIWVLDFLLRRPLEDRTRNALLRALPLSCHKPVLGKLLLLNELEAEVSRHSVSESTLKVLERLEEFEFREGSERVSDSMRRAYCAVAVECSVKILVNGDRRDDEVRFKFFETVVRLWKRRFELMEKEVERGGLGSQDMWMWKEEIEAAALDDDACENILKKIEDVNAVEAVQDYLREERENMGPSFLELVADRAKDDEVLHNILRVTSSCPLTVDVRNANDGIRKGNIHLQNKVVGLRHSTGSVSKHSKRAKIVDSDEMTYGPPHRDLNLPSTAEFKRVRESIKSSSLDLQAVVKDPLPDAIKIAEAISGVLNERKCRYPAGENHVEDISGVSGGNEHHNPGEEAHVEDISGVSGGNEHQNPGEEVHVEDISGVSGGNEHHNPGEEVHVESISGVARECEHQDVEEHSKATLFFADGAGVVQGIGTNITDLPSPSLMQQNAAACTNERREPHGLTSGSRDDPDDHQDRRQLPTPSSTKASPLKRYENVVPKKRRRPRKWSPLEEQTLKAAVEEFGLGRWKYILDVHHDIFLGRTHVDLKDKWRNMSRY